MFKINVLIKKSLLYRDSDLKVFTFERFSSKAALEQYFNSSYFIIILINSGCITLQANHVEYCLCPSELLVIPVRTSCVIVLMSETMEISLLSFTPGFIFKNTIRKPNIGFFEFFIAKCPSKINIKDEDSLLLNDLFALTGNKRYKTSEYPFYNEVLSLSFNLLLYVLASIYSKDSCNVKEKHTRKEKLVFQFLELVELHCAQEHSVKFYADALLITKGHLSKTVQQVTNKTVKQFIEEALILEAKILLQNDDLTILQIIEELHFCNSSSFSNFFRKSTFMSPSEYRLRLRTE